MSAFAFADGLSTRRSAALNRDLTFVGMSAPLPVPCSPRLFYFAENEVTALVPDAQSLRARYAAGEGAPYWARLWPASLGLCEYLAEHPELVAGKRVLELAAGLGLPGLLAAQWAAEVILSDIDPAAVDVMQASVALNGLKNVRCQVIDWARIPANVSPDLVLLSDVNYEPAVFDQLFGVLSGLLERGLTVMLSTPQRLMAKPFIERLLPWCREQREYAIDGEYVSVFLLR